MKPSFLIIFLFAIVVDLFGQSEMEKNCLEIIRTSTKDVVFPKYEGIVVRINDTIHFGKSIICLKQDDSQLLSIFTNGLIFPSLIRSASTGFDRKFKMTNISDADTLNINSLVELNIPNQKAGFKTFSFLLWAKGFANPYLYIFELHNESEYFNRSFERFVKNARITAFGFCSILI